MAISFDKKLTQLKLQHDIIYALKSDNSISCHFDYHVNLMSDDETVKLNLLTYNPRHNEYMLFHSVLGSSSLNCLEKMKSFVNTTKTRVELNSFTITWSKKDDDKQIKSYFIAENEREAISKFLHEKNADEYTFSIELNPVS